MPATAQDSEVNVTHMISAHEIKNGLTFSRPTVLPKTFWIPSVNVERDELRDRCVVYVREVSDRNSTQVKYAKIWRKGQHPVVLLTIPDAQVIRHGTEEQKADEWNQVLTPPIARAFLYLRAGKLADDIQDEFRRYGVMRIKGEEPTDDEVHEAWTIYREFVVGRITEANSGYERYGQREITPQVLELATTAFKNKWITALPKWASMDLTPGENPGVFACEACGQPLRSEAVKCHVCGAVYNWRKAVELGIVKPSDVPPSRKREAGLPEEVPAVPSVKS